MKCAMKSSAVMSFLVCHCGSQSEDLRLWGMRGFLAGNIDVGPPESYSVKDKKNRSFRQVKTVYQNRWLLKIFSYDQPSNQVLLNEVINCFFLTNLLEFCESDYLTFSQTLARSVKRGFNKNNVLIKLLNLFTDL